MTDALKPNDKPWWFPNRAPGGSDPETGRPYTYTHDNLHDALDQLDKLSDAYLALRAAPQPGKAEGEDVNNRAQAIFDVLNERGCVPSGGAAKLGFFHAILDGLTAKLDQDGERIVPVEPGRG